MPPRGSSARKKGDESVEKKAPAPVSAPASPATPAPGPASPETEEFDRNQDETRRRMFTVIRLFAKVVREDKSVGALEKELGSDNRKRFAALWMLSLWNGAQPPDAADFTKVRAPDDATAWPSVWC